MKSLNPMLTWPARTHLLLIHAALVLGLLAAPAHAATFVVTNNADSGPGSLRQAVADANVGGGTILFSNVIGTITLTSDQLIFTKNLTLVGPQNLTISGGNMNRIFRIDPGSTSSISGLIIRDGLQTDDGTLGGGGVHNRGSLTLSNCLVSNSRSVYRGGGLHNQGTLTLHACIVSDNIAGPLTGFGNPGLGGGIYNLGHLKMINSSVVRNMTLAIATLSSQGSPQGAHGGGIYNAGTLFLTNSTISLNLCGQGTPSEGNGGDGGSGGGIYTVSFASLRGCTINGNQCGNGGLGGTGFVGNHFPFSGGLGGSGGGIYSAGTAYLTNCTIYGNSTGAGGRGGLRAFPLPQLSGDGGNGGHGAGVYIQAGAAVMASCTVSAGSTGAGGATGLPDMGTPGNAGSGGGIWSSVGTSQLLNTIIASNTASGGAPDVGGSFTSLGHNLISNTNGSQGFPGNNDLNSVDPKLGPLAGNGGPALTCALLPDSPARGAGDDSLTGTDQRGFARSSGGQVDIGAYELQVPSGPIVLTGLRTNEVGGFQFSFTNTARARFRVVSSTNVATPGTNWPVVHNSIDSPTGHFEYTDSQATNTPVRFFRVVWP